MKNRFIIFIVLLFLTKSIIAQVADSAVNFDLLQTVTVTAGAEKKSTLMRFLQSQYFSSVDDILSRMQSMSVIRRGSYGQETVIRGLNGGQINMTIDGMHLFGACTDKMDPPNIYIEPLNLKNIQVNTSVDEIATGSSLGGSVNMQLYDPVFSAAKKTSANVYGVYNSIASGVNTGADFSFADTKNAVRISGVYRKQHDYEDGNGQTVLYSGYEKLNASLAYKRKLNNYASVKVDMLLDDGWNIGYPALPMDAGYASARIFAATYMQQLRKGFINDFQVKGYYNTIHHYMDDSRRADVTQHMDMPGKSDVTGITGQAIAKAFRNHSFNLKAEWYQNNAFASMTMYDQNSSMYMLTLPDTRRNVISAALKDSWVIDSLNSVFFTGNIDGAFINVVSEAGKNQLRVFDQQNFQQQRLVWALNAAWQRKISKSWKTRIIIGKGERLPVNNELFGFYLFNRQDGYDYIGNDNLKNELSYNAELSAKFTSSKLEFNVSAFFNYIQNYILGITLHDVKPMTVNANGVKQFTNVDYAKLYGSEISVIYSPLCHLKFIHTSKLLWGSMQNGEYVPMISPYKATTSVYYSINNFSVSVENETAAAQHRYNTNYGEDFTKGFTLFNIKGDYHLQAGKVHFKIFGGVENLFNAVYHEHLDWGNINRPGRNLFAGLQVGL